MPEIPVADKGKLAAIMQQLAPKELEALLKALDDPLLTGGQIAVTLNLLGYPATRSQVNHYRRRTRAQQLLEEAHA